MSDDISNIRVSTPHVVAPPQVNFALAFGIIVAAVGFVYFCSKTVTL